ncbi:MAG: phospholipid carrier-dependent glycosyltransferase, partial [Gloeomargaritaceae cyanobacterium C42_A2020_066]|nr:phospholipid carrier-dependent glycosyltransferase [Gloeomargaritaceae cyanobacterium C42_A2020_066]
LTGCLVALDGLLLVESRYALINLYLVFFGLLGQVLWLKGRRAEHPLGWQLLGGIALGASVSVKWNGLGYLAGLALYGLARSLPTPAGREAEAIPWRERWRPWARHGLCLGVVPAATYLLLWQPHLRQSPGATLLTLHQQILGYHQNLGATVHPYCSPWWSWPLMLRPVSYFYAKVGPAGQELIGNVQGMGNPVLWGLVAGAVLLGLGYGVWWTRSTTEEREPCPSPLLFGLLNVAANWLPWALARRCLFIYHYLPALIAGCLVLAWWLDEAWKGPAGRLLAGMLLGLIGLGFYFWLPIYLGLPLTPAEWQRRFPFSGWI